MIERRPIEEAPRDGTPVLAVIESPSGKGQMFVHVVWRAGRWHVMGDENARPVITEFVVVR
jgi:hypothetical protein